MSKLEHSLLTQWSIAVLVNKVKLLKLVLELTKHGILLLGEFLSKLSMWHVHFLK